MLANSRFCLQLPLISANKCLQVPLVKIEPLTYRLSYYEMKIPNATCLAQRYGITRQAADKRLKKIEEKIKKLVAIF